MLGLHKNILGFVFAAFLVFPICACSQTIDALVKEYGQTKDIKNKAVLYDKTKKQLEGLIHRNPQDAENYYLLGKLNFYAEKDDESLEGFNEAIQLDPKKGKYYFMKGVLLGYGHKPEESETALQEAVRLEPRNTDYQNELGRTLYRDGKSDQAIKCYSALLEQDPKIAQAQLNLGALYMERKQYEEAVQHFKKAVEIDPQMLDAHLNLGLAFWEIGKNDLSLAAYKNASELFPNDLQIKAKLVQGYEVAGDKKKRDLVREKLLALREKGVTEGLPNPKFYCRDQFRVGFRKVFAFEYFKLEAKQPFQYSFEVLNPDAGEKTAGIEYRIGLESTEFDNAFAKETKEIPKNGRIYFLDQYWDNGNHASFGSFKSLPSYDVIKPLVLQIIQGKINPVTSTTLKP